MAQIEQGIKQALAKGDCINAASYAVNLIVHETNDRLDHDLGVCIDHKVLIIITSLHALGKVVQAVHDHGG